MLNRQKNPSSPCPSETFDTNHLYVELPTSKKDSDEATVVLGLQSQIQLLQETANGHQREVERVLLLLAQAEQRYEEQVKITEALKRQMAQWSTWLQAAPCAATTASNRAPPVVREEAMLVEELSALLHSAISCKPDTMSDAISATRRASAAGLPHATATTATGISGSFVGASDASVMQELEQSALKPEEIEEEREEVDEEEEDNEEVDEEEEDNEEVDE
ncbi:hypothetical protein DFQ26_001424 [Actinomortierella ambigua]|nr:hypothetical protein DFQ26_001424 [Actinomortierella ambigua]